MQIEEGEMRKGPSQVKTKRREQEQITSQALKLEESLNGLPDSLTKALANDTERQWLLTTTTELGKLQSLLVEDMPVALQLNIGFNALDGD